MSKPQAKFPTSATHGLPLQRRYVAPQAQLQLMGALDVANRRATFVASCGSVDSFGTRFVAQGLLLDRLRKNPVFLWQHNRTDPDDAIGKLQVHRYPRRPLIGPAPLCRCTGGGATQPGISPSPVTMR